MMRRDILRIDYDITKDYVDRLERLNGLADGRIQDPHLTKLDHLAWVMLAVLVVGWVIANL